jgi:hypothetical protein
VTRDEVDAVVELLDRLLRRTGDEVAEARRWQHAERGRALLEAHLELQPAELRAAFTHLVDVLPTLDHRRAWASARTWLRAGRRLSQTTPSLPYVVQLVNAGSVELERGDELLAGIVGDMGAGPLRDGLDAVRVGLATARRSLKTASDALYPPRPAG